MRGFNFLCSLLTAVMAVFLYVSPVYAHPGNTDGNGCHTCRTNCTESWGIPYGFYHRHYPVRPCFEPAASTPTPYVAPTKGVVVPPAPPATPTPWPTIEQTIVTSTPIPTNTPTPTILPTTTSMPIPTATPMPTLIPTNTPTPVIPTGQAQVLGQSSNNSSGVFGAVVTFIGFAFIFWRAVNQKWPFHSKI